MVTCNHDDRQGHQEVAHDFSETVSDLGWSVGGFQVFVRDEDVGRGDLDQEERRDVI